MKIKESDYLLWNIYHSVIALLLGALVVIEGIELWLTHLAQ